MENNKPKIEIKKENRGKFTQHCKDAGYEGVTDKCIEEGLASKSAGLRSQAQFAKNVRQFKH